MAKTAPGALPGKTPSPDSKKSDGGVVSWLFNIVLGGNDPEREKRRQLKILA